MKLFFAYCLLYQFVQVCLGRLVLAGIGIALAIQIRIAQPRRRIERPWSAYGQDFRKKERPQ